jgi:hypothetical protein
MEAPKKIKNRTAIYSSNTTPRDISQGMLSQVTTKALAQPCLL